MKGVAANSVSAGLTPKDDFPPLPARLNGKQGRKGATAAAPNATSSSGTSLAAKFLRENGITLFKVREETVELLGKADMFFFSPEHPPLTEPAQKALDWAIEEKLKSGESGEVTTTHFLLGIWAQKESAGHRIMAANDFDDEKAKEIAKNVGSVLLHYLETNS